MNHPTVKINGLQAAVAQLQLAQKNQNLNDMVRQIRCAEVLISDVICILQFYEKTGLLCPVEK